MEGVDSVLANFTEFAQKKFKAVNQWVVLEHGLKNLNDASAYDCIKTVFLQFLLKYYFLLIAIPNIM